MKYFTITELTKSSKAKSLNIDNHPTPEIVDNLTILIEECLDKIREIYGKPIIVNSGYRCEKLNQVLKGSKTSHHLQGLAADITVGSKEENELLFQLILDNDIQFTQLIDEYNFSWIHISHDPNNLKHQIIHTK